MGITLEVRWTDDVVLKGLFVNFKQCHQKCFFPRQKGLAMRYHAPGVVTNQKGDRRSEG